MKRVPLPACLVNGQHEPGSRAEAECPLRHAAARFDRARRAAAARWGLCEPAVSIRPTTEAR